MQTIPEVSPTKWHLAHVTWFLRTISACSPTTPGTGSSTSATTISSIPTTTRPATCTAGPTGVCLSRPTVEEIRKYREHVDAAMLELIEQRADDPDFAFSRGRSVSTTSSKHQEFAAYGHQARAVRQSARTSLLASTDGVGHRRLRVRRRRSSSSSFEGGQFEIGCRRPRLLFSTTRTPRHSVLVADHAIANRPITKRGVSRVHRRRRLSRSGHLALRRFGQESAPKAGNRPHCWSEDMTSEFTLRGWREIDPHSPVCHVSFYEADAFRPPGPAHACPRKPNGKLAAVDTKVHGNLLDSDNLHPVAGPRRGGDRHRDRPTMGATSWEWTASSYDAYPGFRTARRVAR